MANQGKAEVAATVEELVSTQVLEVLTAEMVIPGTITDESAQAGPGIDKVKIPKFGNFTVQTKVANTPLTGQTNTFSTADMDLDRDKHVPFLLEDIANLQSKIAMTQVLLDQAGKDLAEEVDTHLISILTGSASAAAPDHLVQFETPSVAAKNDILAGRALLNKQKVPKGDRVLLVDSDQETNLMKISEFTRVDESGGSEALRNGLIGKLFGFDVIEHANMTADTMLMYHRTTAAFATQQVINTENSRDAFDVGTKWRVGHLYGAEAALDSGKRIVEINATGA